MEPAVLAARLIGPLFVVVAVGILLNGDFYTALIAEAMQSPTLIYFSGLISIIPGLAILNFHRAWTADWRVVITLLGYLLTIGGIVRIVFPLITATMAALIYSNASVLPVLGVIVLIVGAYLCFEGYRHRAH